MAQQGFARLKPKAASAADKAGPAPTPTDRAQSDVHHVSSVQYNLAHAITHAQEAQKHASKLSNTLRTMPATAAPAQALDAAMSSGGLS